PAGRVARAAVRPWGVRRKPGRGRRTGRVADPGEGRSHHLRPRRQPRGGGVRRNGAGRAPRPRVYPEAVRMSLTVLDPGLHSLVVDHGRPRSRHLGVPLGGAADRAALALGNALVGNPPDAAALEVTMVGPTLRAEHRTVGVVF